MAGIAGKSFLLKYGTTSGGSFTTIADLSNASLTINGELVDITAFAATYGANVAGIKTVSLSASGFWNSGDTGGQVALRTAFLADTETWLQFLPNGSTGFKCQFLLTSFEIGAEVKGGVPLSFSAVGTGAVSAV